VCVGLITQPQRIRYTFADKTAFVPNRPIFK
jgi:hypothetical protein